MRLKEGRFDAALEAYERVLTLDGLNQAAKKGLLAVAEARQNAKTAKRIPLERVPVLRLTAMALSQQHFDPQEGFVLSRINGSWDVRSLLKLCPDAGGGGAAHLLPAPRPAGHRAEVGPSRERRREAVVAGDDRRPCPRVATRPSSTTTRP